MCAITPRSAQLRATAIRSRLRPRLIVSVLKKEPLVCARLSPGVFRTQWLSVRKHDGLYRTLTGELDRDLWPNWVCGNHVFFER